MNKFFSPLNIIIKNSPSFFELVTFPIVTKYRISVRFIFISSKQQKRKLCPRSLL